jgi:hypothetical protein
MQRRILLLASTVLIGGAFALSIRPQTTSAASPTATPAAAETFKVDPPARQALFGELHLHTSYSYDAWGFGPWRLTPDDAYHFAQGKPIDLFGQQVRRDEPLDFMAVTDHSEYMGVLSQLDDPTSPLSTAASTKAYRDDHTKAWEAVNREIHGGTPPPELNVGPAMKGAWAREVAAANANYNPGRFTTFIAYEWSSMPNGDNLHRNVIFAGNRAPLPFSSVDSERPEDLWSYLERVRRTGSDVIAIPHNANASGGLMFDWVDSDRHPISEAYALRRASNEPLLEIYQSKGSSETHPELSPADEFSNFEKWDKLLIDNKRSEPHGSYARDGLGRGLIIQSRVGANPYKIGFVGASDIHSGMSSSSEADAGRDRFNPKDGTPGVEKVRNLFEPKPAGANGEKKIEVSVKQTTFGSAGLTGVWAETNNRPSIFAALRRRETFATSGTRLKLRFFGGWGYSQDLLRQASWAAGAYRGGVPMGSDLPAAPAAGRAPSFILWATKDPNNANLDRIQVVKVWLEKGAYREKVFDIAWSGARRPDARTGKLPAVGNTVDIKSARYTNSIGTAALQHVWRDPEFNPSTPAVYYARVLEIPTPRWTTYLAARYSLTPPSDVPVTIQERGWSSPIWYTPPAARRVASR